MDDLERLAGRQAMFKELSKHVSTKDPDSLRSVIDRELLRMYEENGIDRIQVRSNGVKTGTLSVRETKGKTYIKLTVTDADTFEEWCETNGFMTPDIDAVNSAIENEGILPDGCEVERIESAPSYSTVLKIDEEAVFNAYGNNLGKVIAGLLEGE